MANVPNWIDIQTGVFILQYIKLQAGSACWYTSPHLSVFFIQIISWNSLFSHSHFPLTLFPDTNDAASTHNMCDGNVWLVGCIWKCIKQKHTNAWRPEPWTCQADNAENTVYSLAVIWDALKLNSKVNVYISNLCILSGYPEQNFPCVHVWNTFYSLVGLTLSYVGRPSVPSSQWWRTWSFQMISSGCPGSSWSGTVKEEGTNNKNFLVLGINYLISTNHFNRLK